MNNDDPITIQFRQLSQPDPLDPRFEDQVFLKIRHRKKQKKVMLGTAALLVVIVSVFLMQTRSLKNSSLDRVMAGKSTDLRVKEEVPLMDDLIYTSSTVNKNYGIQQVAYIPDQGSL